MFQFFFYQYMCQFFILIFITISTWGVFFFLNNSNKIFIKKKTIKWVNGHLRELVFFLISTCLSFFFFFNILNISSGGFFFLLNNNKVLKNKNKSRLLGEYSYFVGTILVQLKHVFYQIILQFYLYLNLEKYIYFGIKKNPVQTSVTS